MDVITPFVTKPQEVFEHLFIHFFLFFFFLSSVGCDGQVKAQLEYLELHPVCHCPHPAQCPRLSLVFHHTQSLGNICSRTFRSLVLFYSKEIELLATINS